MRYLFISTFFLINLSSVFSQDCCRKPEIEMGIGPQWSIPRLYDSEVGTGDANPDKKSALNYNFYTAIRTHPATLQAGMEIIHDRKSFNVFLPLFWPMGISSWDHVYTTYRLGIGAHGRINADRFHMQLGAANMYSMSRQTKIEFDEPGVGIKSLEGEYSSKNGWLFQMQIGYKLDEAERWGTSIGFVLDQSEHEYANEMYHHYWKVRTNMVNLTLSYRLNNPDQ